MVQLNPQLDGCCSGSHVRACMVCPPRSEVDHVITTKDLAAMCKEKGIDFASLPGEQVAAALPARK